MDSADELMAGASADEPVVAERLGTWRDDDLHLRHNRQAERCFASVERKQVNKEPRCLRTLATGPYDIYLTTGPLYHSGPVVR